MLKMKIKGETKLFSVTLLIPAAILSVKTNVSYVMQQKLKVSLNNNTMLLRDSGNLTGWGEKKKKVLNFLSD